MKYGRIRKETARYARLLYDRGYVTALEGNISVKISDNFFLMTPSRIIKKFLGPHDIVEIDGKGKKLKGEYSPSTESSTHLEIYRQNPDVEAVIHAHPFYTLLCTATGLKPFEKICLAEAAIFLKNTVFAPYARPSTGEGALIAGKYSKGTQVLVIDRHGSFTYGRNLFEAFSLLELLEKYCKMFYFAGLSGKEIHYFDEEEIKKLGHLVPRL